MDQFLLRRESPVTKRALQTKPELLAPARDFSCLAAALRAGCDAVYFGVQRLNMRAGAANFELSDLARIRARCRRFGAKVYLTLNTIVFDDELVVAGEIIQAAHDHVDAIICWDPGVIALCREAGIPFHVSTQASVANASAARFYSDLGASRIIPARECSLAQIREIREGAGIEVEVFVHGAMCVAQSGRCFMSEHTTGHSGNRGECLQSCRREYLIIDDSDAANQFVIGSNYVMSAQDLCTLPFIEKLAEAGIDAFKIEGRNRDPHYVHTVTTCYRQAVDAWHDGTLTPQLKEHLVHRLHTAFHRGFSGGFFFGKPVTDFTDTDGSKASLRKAYVGKVVNYYARPGVASLQVQDNGFSTGDRLLVEGPTTGVVEVCVSEFLLDERSAAEASHGLVTIVTPCKVRRNDRVFRLDTRASV